MTANTVTGQEILFKMAMDCGEVTSQFITGVTSQTVLVCRGVGEGLHETYKYALARVLGKGIRQITAWDKATETLTLASGFDTNVSAGELIQVAWQDAVWRSLAVQAINEAIRQSWAVWSRETVVDRSSATLTLASGTHAYALPGAVGYLLRVGIQPQTSSPIEWFEPYQGGWNIEGQEGAYTLRFAPGFGGSVMPAWSSRVRLAGVGGTFADVFSGQVLCLHYVARESEITAETGTTQLPLDYFTRASVLYLQSKLTMLQSEQELARVTALLAVLRQQAAQAGVRLSRTKQRPMQVTRLQY